MNSRNLARQIRVLLPPLIIALFTFELIVGYERLIPTNIAWLTRTGWTDGWGAYLGWETYRYSPLKIPIGSNIAYGMDMGNSLVYTDSIPLLAIPLKFFSPLLPVPFQYFGFWLLICFCFQALISWQLFIKYTNDKLKLTCVTLILIFSPILLQRINVHMSQVGHFLFLWALYLITQPKSKQSFRWLFLITISALVHPYFFVMNFSLFIADELYRRNLAKLNYHAVIKNITLNGLLSVPILWLSGYFVSFEGATNPFQNDLFKMDLIQPFNFTGWSLLLAKKFPYQQGNFEGFNYFGPGILFLASICLISAIYKRHFKQIRMKFNRTYLPIMIVLLLFTLFAVTYKVTLARIELFEVPLPGELKDLLSSFRASGRFFAPVYYFISFFVLKTVIGIPDRRLVCSLLILATSFQVVDTRMGWAPIKSIVRPQDSLEIGVVDLRSWSHILTNKRNILTIPSRVPSELCQEWRLVGYLAYTFKLRTNCFYFARSSAKRKMTNRESTIYLVEQGDPSRENVIVLGRREYLEFFHPHLSTRWNVTKISNLVVLTPPT